MRRFLSVMLTLVALPAFAQPDLSSCIEMAYDNYPQIMEYELIDRSEAYDLSNAARSWIPQLGLSAKATWQSTVVEMPFDIPGMEFDIPHDQYGITADLTQPVWDGGAGAAKRENAVAGADVRRRQLDVNLYSIRSRVQSVYMGIILLDKQLGLNDVLAENLRRSIEEVSALMEGGIALQSDLDQLKVSLLSCRQQRSSLEADRRAYVRMLGLLTGADLSGASFAEPQVAYPSADAEISRPELALYDAQLRQTGVQRRQLDVNWHPRLNLNLQAGYGRPGLNMLSGESDPFFIAGVKLQWNFGPLSTIRNDRKKLDAEASRVELMRRSFLLNTSVEAEQKRVAVDKAAEVLACDDEIVELRRSITETASRQYREGVIKMNDYLGILDDEFTARLNRNLHEVQYIMAVFDLNYTLGK